MTLDDLVKIINAGGNVALLMCAVFINRASERLARIEKALSKYMDENK